MDVTNRVLPQYLGCALAWGASFLFIKIGLEGLSAPQVVLGRLAAGALTLLVISLVTRQAVPRGWAVWGHLVVLAALLCVLPFLLFAWAELHIASGLASIYNATTPLMTTSFALLTLPSERPTRVRLLGLLTGFAGVLVVLGPWHLSLGGSVTAQLACLLATACYGLAFVHMRRFVSPLGLGALPIATVQVGLAALFMLAIAPWVAAQPVQLTPRVVLSVLALGSVGTGLAYVWNTNVVAGWGATNASTVTYLTPLVGVVLGALVLSESLAWNQPVGAVVVVAGIAISQGRVPAGFRRRAPEPG